MRMTEINAMSKTLKMKRNRQKYKCTSLPWWIFALASISSQLLTGSCKGKQILVRTCWRTSWIYCAQRYHWLLVVYPLSDSSNDLVSFISAKKTLRRKIIAFFTLKTVCNFLSIVIANTRKQKINVVYWRSL